MITTTQMAAFDGQSLTTITSEKKTANGAKVIEYQQTISFCKRCKSEVWVPDLEGVLAFDSAKLPKEW